jgi:MYXO-CTERM domain-containing protein
VRTRPASCHPFLLIGALFLLPGVADAYAIADTVGDGSGAPLQWPAGEPVPFRFHFRGSDDLGPQSLQRLTRASFATWGLVPEADLTFEEGRIFVGPAAHHSEPSQVDLQSALFFIEGVWPFGPEVIALTSVSFASDGEILDADIAFNGADHTFTTVDSGGVKDYVSIATHEIGHFLGLAHSDAPGATMGAEYENGETYLRDLAPDDAAGIAFLYPCGSEPCLGRVGWRDRAGCATGGGGAPWFALLALGSVLLMRRRRSGLGLALVAAAGVLLPGSADSSLVEELPVEELAAGAERVIRGTVVETHADLADGFVTTRATLEVTEDWQGGGESVIELALPGGLLDQPVDVVGPTGEIGPKQLAGTLVFGAPRLRVDDDVVVFVQDAREGTVRGLAQGVFFVGPEGAVAQDTSGLAFARVGGEAPRPVAAPGRLAALRAEVDRAGRSGLQGPGGL